MASTVGGYGGYRRRPPVVLRGDRQLLAAWVQARQAAGDLVHPPPRARRLRGRDRWQLTVPATYLHPGWYRRWVEPRHDQTEDITDRPRSEPRAGWPRAAVVTCVAAVVAGLGLAAGTTDTGQDVARSVGAAVLVGVLVAAALSVLVAELRSGR